MDFAQWVKENGLKMADLVSDNEAFKAAQERWKASLPKYATPSKSPAGEAHLILYVNGKHAAEIKLTKGRSKDRDTIVNQFQNAKDAKLSACLVRQQDGTLSLEATTESVSADALGAFACGKEAPAVPSGTVKRGKK